MIFQIIAMKNSVTKDIPSDTKENSHITEDIPSDAVPSHRQDNSEGTFNQ